ncbi:MAG: hypothetical protein GSR79_05045 [Desulfurococcales archaeon]|nr:hypothetical protein [Desulfurococcales archaeon]
MKDQSSVPESLLERFQVFIGTEEGRKWKRERVERESLYQRLLDVSHIDSLSMEDFSLVIKSLWASNIWTNKDWLVQKILEDNGGIENIRRALKELLYGSGSIGERYDRFIKRVKRIGPSMLTEILAFTNPESYCIWNEKPKAVLPFLGMDKQLPSRMFRYQITGQEYEKCISVLSKIRDSLRGIIKKPDFIDVDFFLAFIFYDVLPKVKEASKESVRVEKVKPHSIIISKHEEAQGALVELGNILGFDTYVPPEDRNKVVRGKRLGELTTLKDLPQFTYPRLLDTVKHIDVIWFKEEFPTYCFEVEDSTDVTKGLLRLYQIRQLGIKPIIIGPENKRNKFLVEIEKDPFYHIKKRYRFVSYEELARLLGLTKEFYDLKNRLLGD